MRITKNNKLRAQFFLSLVFIFCLLGLLNGHTEEVNIYGEKQEQAIDNANNDSSSAALDYRQKLSKTIVIEEEFYHQDLDSYIRYMPSQGVSAQSGRVGIIDSATEYSYSMKVFDQLPVEFGLGVRYIGISNTTPVKLPSRLTNIFIGVETTLPFFSFKNTYFAVALAPEFYTDNWAIRSSALSLTQRYFFIYQANNQLTFIAGLSVSPHENNPLMPILGFIYKPNDKLTFNIIPKQPEISYILSEKLTIFAQADITMNEYRVTRDGVKNTVLEYNEMHAGVGIKYQVNKEVQGAFSVGRVLNQTIKYQDVYGKIAVKHGLYTEFRVDISM